MRFVVNVAEVVYVEDRFTRTRRAAASIPEAHREADRLNDTMFTRSTHQVVIGFSPIHSVSLESQINFIAAVMGQR